MREHNKRGRLEVDRVGRRRRDGRGGRDIEALVRAQITLMRTDSEWRPTKQNGGYRTKADWSRAENGGYRTKADWSRAERL